MASLERAALAGRPRGPEGEVTRGPIEIDLTGESFSVELEELLPSGTPIAHDGAGNFWVLDEPHVLLQSADLETFLQDAAEATNPGTLDLAAALADDPELRAFAAELDERLAFVELRTPAPPAMTEPVSRATPRA